MTFFVRIPPDSVNYKDYKMRNGYRESEARELNFKRYFNYLNAGLRFATSGTEARCSLTEQSPPRPLVCQANTLACQARGHTSGLFIGACLIHTVNLI